MRGTSRLVTIPAYGETADRQTGITEFEFVSKRAMKSTRDFLNLSPFFSRTITILHLAHCDSAQTLGEKVDYFYSIDTWTRALDKCTYIGLTGGSTISVKSRLEVPEYEIVIIHMFLLSTPSSVHIR